MEVLIASWLSGGGHATILQKASEFPEVGSWEVTKLAFKPGLKNGETGPMHGPSLPAQHSWFLG